MLILAVEENIERRSKPLLVSHLRFGFLDFGTLRGAVAFWSHCCVVSGILGKWSFLVWSMTVRTFTRWTVASFDLLSFQSAGLGCQVFCSKADLSVVSRVYDPLNSQ
jgi:hypothetical protein